MEILPIENAARVIASIRYKKMFAWRIESQSMRSGHAGSAVNVLSSFQIENLD